MIYTPSLTHPQTAELYCKVKDRGLSRLMGRAQPLTHFGGQN